jgi:hypothetical protein
MQTYFRNPKVEELTLRKGEVVECELCGDKLTSVYHKETNEVVAKKSNGEVVQIGFIDGDFRGYAVDPLAWAD